MKFKTIGPHAIWFPSNLELHSNNNDPSSSFLLADALENAALDGWELKAVIPGFQVSVRNQITRPGHPDMINLPAACAILSKKAAPPVQ